MQGETAAESSVLRRFAGETLVYGVTTVLVRLATFLLTPLYTNLLRPAELGEVSYLYALLAFANVLLTMGWESAYMRFAVEREGEARQQVFGLAWSTVAINAVSAGLLVWGAAPVVAPWLQLRYLGEEGLRVAAAIAVCDALTVVPFAELRLRRQVGAFAALRLGNIGLLVVATVVWLVVLRSGPLGVLWAGLTASAATAAATFRIVWRCFRWRWDGQLYRAMLRYALPTLPAALAGIALQVVDRPLLMLLTDARTVGIYQANYRLALPMLLVVSAFEYAWRPFFLHQAERPEAPRLFARLFVHWNALAALAFVLLVVWMPFLVRVPLGKVSLVHPAYWEGLGIVPIVAGGYWALGLYTIAAAAAHIRKRTEYLALALGTAAVVNVGLIVLLVPVLGYSGAAWATLGAYGVAAGIMVKVGHQLYPVPYPWARVAVFWVLAVGTGLLVGLQASVGERVVGTLAAAVLLWGWWWLQRNRAV